MSELETLPCAEIEEPASGGAENEFSEARSAEPPRTQSGVEPFARPLSKRALWPGVLLLLVAVGAIPFAEWTYHPIYQLLRHLPLREFFATANQFAGVTMTVLILAGICLLQPKRRPTILYCLVALGVAGLFNTSFKGLTLRARPRYSIQMGKKEAEWLAKCQAAYPDARIAIKRGDQWVGPYVGRLSFKEQLGSFPSGHANSAFVLASYLAALYPEARILWYLAAGGTGAARVVKERHWPEDVLFGGALGWLVAHIVFSWRWPGRLGLKLFGEKRWWRRRKKTS